MRHAVFSCSNMAPVPCRPFSDCRPELHAQLTIQGLSLQRNHSEQWLCCREETSRLKKQLDEYEEDWVKLQNTEKNYQLEADQASQHLDQLRGSYDPAAQCAPQPLQESGALAAVLSSCSVCHPINQATPSLGSQDFALPRFTDPHCAMCMCTAVPD